MTSYLGIINKKISIQKQKQLVQTINPLNTLDTKTIKNSIGFFAVSYHKNAPLKGDKYFEDKEWIAIFAGDLIQDKLNWKQIIQIIKKEEYKKIADFNGTFTISAFNKKTKQFYIISDRRSQLPIYYHIENKKIFISTEMSTFCRLNLNLKFNEKWLWEYLFFNYPIGQTTFLENVYRMKPASVLKINIETGEYNNIKYATMFKKKQKLIEGKHALEHADNIFRNRIPEYYNGSKDIACSITAGWDSRTNLCFSPNLDYITAYTYGIPGCSDLVKSKESTDTTNLIHKAILFDKRFEEKLSDLMFKTIYLTSGLQHITRSTLLYVYKNLTENGKKHPLTMSGISLDIQFRGNGALLCKIISPDMARILSTGKKEINDIFWKKCMGDKYESFKEHIMKKLKIIEKKYGKLNDAQTHLNFFLYEFSPKYWVGECNIAKYFTTLRVPAWDNEIIKLSYSIEYSMLSFSHFLRNPDKDIMDEMILQAYLIYINGSKLKDITVNSILPEAFLKGKLYYYIHLLISIFPRGINFLLNRKKVSNLENWNKWLNETLKNDIYFLIFKDKSLIKNYINSEFISSLKNKPIDDFTAKITSLELILRLFENNWSEEFDFKKESY